MPAIKVLDASSGSAEFKTADNKICWQLVITGSPSANIKAFIQDKDKEINAAFLKVSCSNWNGASVALKAKTNHIDDSFTETGQVFSANRASALYYN
jgi:hypothetical protein